MKKDVGKKIVASILAVATTASVSLLTVATYLENKIKNIKSPKQIEMEMGDLAVDGSVVGAILNIEPNKPVVIEYDGNMPEEEILLIDKAVDYYDKIFKTIDEDYSFVAVSDEENEGKNVRIKMTNENLEEKFLSPNGIFYHTCLDTSKGDVILNSRIVLDWEKIKDDYEWAYYAIIHELSHAVGFNDVYTDENHKNSRHNYSEYSNKQTITNTFEQSFVFFPNDYACLQTMYSREYLKQNSYEEALSIMDKKIEKYTYKYYSFIADDFINNSDTCLYAEEESFENLNLEWRRIDVNGIEYNYFITAKNGSFNFQIKDSKGKTIEHFDGGAHYCNGGLFLDAIRLNDISSFISGSGKGKTEISLAIFLDNDGKYEVKDFVFNYSRSGLENKTAQNKVNGR